MQPLIRQRAAAVAAILEDARVRRRGSELGGVDAAGGVVDDDDVAEGGDELGF